MSNNESQSTEALEPCGVCKFHWNLMVMPGELHNPNCPHFDDAEKGCVCQECRQRFKVDVLAPDELWNLIIPEGKPIGAGLLCGRCVFSRIEALGQFDAFTLSRTSSVSVATVDKQAKNNDYNVAEWRKCFERRASTVPYSDEHELLNEIKYAARIIELLYKEVLSLRPAASTVALVEQPDDLAQWTNVDVWPVRDLLGLLADAVDHLFAEHECDADGWEKFKYAARAARRHIALLDASIIPIVSTNKERCGECDEIIEGSHFCFVCIEVLKEKLRAATPETNKKVLPTIAELSGSVNFGGRVIIDGDDQYVTSPNDPQRCLHCDASFVPTGTDDRCYCVCHRKDLEDIF